jgi:hypothetical protein
MMIMMVISELALDEERDTDSKKTQRSGEID